MVEPRVMALCIIYIDVGTISYAIGYFIPQIIRGIGPTVLATGFVAAIPAIAGAIGMVVVG
jgi:ACS family tartrate transporter-like MFS transporter